MSYDFHHKTVLISGGNSGIGKACALMFAKYGANVAIAARREAESLAVVKTIEDAGGRAHFIATDVSQRHDIDNMVTATIEHFGALDFAINNAGIIGPTGVPLAEYPLEEYRKVMNINAEAVFSAMQAELKQMVKQKSGVIINMSSLAGLKAGRASSIYTASKHAVTGLTRAAAREYAPAGIRVNALCPAFVKTEMLDTLSSEQEALAKMLPAGRLGHSDEVAQAACWLCSDLSGFVTGVSIPIDGGALA